MKQDEIDERVGKLVEKIFAVINEEMEGVTGPASFIIVGRSINAMFANFFRPGLVFGCQQVEKAQKKLEESP